MQIALNIIRSTLEDGMSDSEQDYYVKTWYTGDPIGLPSFNTPGCSITPAQPSPVEPTFVGEDTDTETFIIRFYQTATRAVLENAETAAGVTKLIAMCDKAKSLLRTDPTFGCNFVSSNIRNINPMLPSVGENNAFRIAEITFEVKIRRMWGN